MRIERLETWGSQREGLVALNAVRFGRLSASIQALPVIMPVAFEIQDDVIFIDVANDRSLLSSLHGAVVAFEGGTFDDHDNLGWMVHVQGIAATAAFPQDETPSALVTITPHVVDAYTYHFSME